MEPWTNRTYHGISIRLIHPLMFKIFLDIQIISPQKKRECFPKFDGDLALEVTHIVNFMKYASSLNVLHEVCANENFHCLH
jgi:hypothetical protein